MWGTEVPAQGRWINPSSGSPVVKIPKKQYYLTSRYYDFLTPNSVLKQMPNIKCQIDTLLVSDRPSSSALQSVDQHPNLPIIRVMDEHSSIRSRKMQCQHSASFFGAMQPYGILPNMGSHTYVNSSSCIVCSISPFPIIIISTLQSVPLQSHALSYIPPNRNSDRFTCT